MSNISLTMNITENVSQKMKQVANESRNASTAVTNAGKEIEKAFSSKTPETFASKIGEALDDTMKSAESLGEALDEAFNDSGSTNAFTENVGGAGQAMESASGKAIGLTSALKGLFAAVSAAAVIHAVGDFASDAVDLGKDYTAMMSEVAAISGATATEIEQMEATAREYGATTIFSATDAAEALKYMSLAGWDAQQSSDALGGVLDLAAASGMELGQASDMVTDYLSAFSMKASDAAYFADMLAYASRGRGERSLRMAARGSSKDAVSDAKERSA